MRLTVTGEASSQMLLRIVNLLAQRGLTPGSVSARVRSGRMIVRLDVALPDGPADILVEKMRSLVEVSEVERHG